jgi:hypothetical protein
VQAGTKGAHAESTPGTSSIRDALHPRAACQPLLAPRMAAGYKIAMGITVGHMLILMA